VSLTRIRNARVAATDADDKELNEAAAGAPTAVADNRRQPGRARRGCDVAFSGQHDSAASAGTPRPSLLDST
jgi:hypothetical protein